MLAGFVLSAFIRCFVTFWHYVDVIYCYICIHASLLFTVIVVLVVYIMLISCCVVGSVLLFAVMLR